MAEEKKYLALTEATFTHEVLESSKPVLVDFWAAWCGPCRAIAPAIADLARDFEDSAKVAKVNVDEQPALAASFGIQSIPTLLFFQNGKVVDQALGAVPKEVLAEKLSALFASA